MNLYSYQTVSFWTLLQWIDDGVYVAYVVGKECGLGHIHTVLMTVKYL